MTARTGLAWVAGAFAVTLVAAVACGSSTAPSPAATPVPSVAPEPIAAPSADAAAAAEDEVGTARQEYAAGRPGSKHHQSGTPRLGRPGAP